MVRDRSHYIHSRTCVIMIQALARGVVVRQRSVDIKEKIQRNENKHRLAIQLQAASRGWLSRRQFTTVLRGMIALQSIWRMRTVWRAYWFLRVSPDERFTLEVAARRIQLSFLIWKMRMAVLEMQSSAVILHRCMRGQLSRSAALFALNHMNASLQHVPLTPVARVSSPTNFQAKSAFMAWDRALGTARVTAAIVIQAAARRMLARQFVEAEFGISFEKEVLELSIRISENEAAEDIQEAFRAWRAP